MLHQSPGSFTVVWLDFDGLRGRSGGVHDPLGKTRTRRGRARCHRHRLLSPHQPGIDPAAIDSIGVAVARFVLRGRPLRNGGAVLLVEINPTEPEPWLIARAADQLRAGKLVVIPTDTVYGLTCGITHQEAIRRVYDLKKMDSKKPLSILVQDMPTIGRYARGVSTPAFRVLKRVLPGPYTFIFEATPEVPKIMLRKRRTIGIRMPNHAVVQALLAALDEPLFTTSLRNPDDDFVNDPVEIEERYRGQIDLVLDGGLLLPIPSTVVDLSAGEPVLVREGKGDVDVLEMFE